MFVGKMGLPYVLTPDEILHKGLLAVKYSEKQLKRVGKKKNLARFRNSYTSDPIVYADLFYRLQTTSILEALLDCDALGREKTLNYFFMALNLLSCYPTELEAERNFVFEPCDRTFREHGWAIVKKISMLAPDIIVWPDDWGNPEKEDNTDETIFVITVDGTHCPIEEPPHEDFSENTKFFSHKFHGAGLDYELGISIFEQKCVWVAGPYPAGTPDITIFRKRLKDKILEDRVRSGVKHRCLGDRGYRGERDVLSIPSSQDTPEVRDFKGRALSRHETFNGRLKFFDSLDEKFRHGIEKHRDCFYACAVIVQLQLDNGFFLFQA